MTVEHGNASNEIGATPVFVAYPAEYRSSGGASWPLVTGPYLIGSRWARRESQKAYPLGVWIPVGISPNDEMHDELVAISPKAEIEI